MAEIHAAFKLEPKFLCMCLIMHYRLWRSHSMKWFLINFASKYWFGCLSSLLRNTETAAHKTAKLWCDLMCLRRLQYCNNWHIESSKIQLRISSTHYLKRYFFTARGGNTNLLARITLKNFWKVWNARKVGHFLSYKTLHYKWCVLVCGLHLTLSLFDTFVTIDAGRLELAKQ